MPSFSVLSTVKENAAILERFTGHCLRLGAEYVHLLYDGDAAEVAANGVAALATSDPRIRLTLLDDDFWEGLGQPRDPVLSNRQRMLYPWAHAQQDCDWMLICDADEFVLDRMPIPDFLSRVPGDVASVVIPPAEAVWGPGEDIRTPFGSTWFRRPRLGSRLGGLAFALRRYGLVGPMFRHGILSHTLGKQFLRRGAAFDLINVHNARAGGQVVSVSARRAVPEAEGLELAHFDAIGYDRWVEKFGRMVASMREDPAYIALKSRPRQLQIRTIARKMDNPAALEALFRRLYVLNDRQLAGLERQGLAFRHDVFTPAQRPAP